MTKQNILNLNWSKMQNLIPAIIQDSITAQILMLGYMSPEALDQTINTNLVTFYSRSKQRLWQKGEISGNYLHVVEIIPDCDNDSLLILVKPQGNTCHLNTKSCFNTEINLGFSFLDTLENVITKRLQQNADDSYIAKLFAEGIQRIAQKVGEEGVEVALAGVSVSRNNLISEAADLIFHLMILLNARNISFCEVINELRTRMKV